MYSNNGIQNFLTDYLNVSMNEYKKKLNDSISTLKNMHLETIYDNVDTLNTIKSNLDILAKISNNINNIDILTTNDYLTKISTVANNMSNVVDLYSNIDSIVVVDNKLSDLMAVKSNLDSIISLSQNIQEIINVNKYINKIQLTGNNIDSIKITADNISNINAFFKVYQGAKDSDPTKRNDSTDLQTGDLYINTTDNVMKIYNGSGWVKSTGDSVNTLKVVDFTGDGSKTEFIVDGGYTANLGIIFLNGTLVTPDISNGTSVKFSTAPADGDKIKCYFFEPFVVNNSSSTSSSNLDSGKVINELLTTLGNGSISSFNNPNNFVFNDGNTGLLKFKEFPFTTPTLQHRFTFNKNIRDSITGMSLLMTDPPIEDWYPISKTGGFAFYKDEHDNYTLKIDKNLMKCKYNNFTISMWFRLSSENKSNLDTVDAGRILSDHTSAKKFNMAIDSSSYKLVFTVGNGTDSDTYDTGVDPNDDKWHHIIIEYSANVGTFIVTLDNTEIINETPTHFTLSEPMELELFAKGKDDSGDDEDNELMGVIDDLLFFDGILGSKFNKKYLYDNRYYTYEPYISDFFKEIMHYDFNRSFSSSTHGVADAQPINGDLAINLDNTDEEYEAGNVFIASYARQGSAIRILGYSTDNDEKDDYYVKGLHINKSDINNNFNQNSFVISITFKLDSLDIDDNKERSIFLLGDHSDVGTKNTFELYYTSISSNRQLNIRIVDEDGKETKYTVLSGAEVDSDQNVYSMSIFFSRNGGYSTSSLSVMTATYNYYGMGEVRYKSTKTAAVNIDSNKAFDDFSKPIAIGGRFVKNENLNRLQVYDFTIHKHLYSVWEDADTDTDNIANFIKPPTFKPSKFIKSIPSKVFNDGSEKLITNLNAFANADVTGNTLGCYGQTGTMDIGSKFGLYLSYYNTNTDYFIILNKYIPIENDEEWAITFWYNGNDYNRDNDSYLIYNGDTTDGCNLTISKDDGHLILNGTDVKDLNGSIINNIHNGVDHLIAISNNGSLYIDEIPCVCNVTLNIKSGTNNIVFAKKGIGDTDTDMRYASMQLIRIFNKILNTKEIVHLIHLEDI